MQTFHKDNLLTFRQSRDTRVSVSARSAFTLVEILVVISILAILTVITITSINFALSSDLTRAGSRQVQSYLAGARDRAIYAKEPRGVRFILDPANPTAVTSMIYIAPSPNWEQGIIRLERTDAGADGTADSPEVYFVRGDGTDWASLASRDLIKEGSRIKIPGDDSGTWYVIDVDGSGVSGGTELLRLTVPYRDPGTSDPDEVIAFTPGSGPSTYLLELPPVILSGEEPTLLPNNTGIDLDRSFLPPSWRPLNGNNVAHVSTGADGQPGKAGVDDDSSGGSDDIDELLWPGSDDYPLYSSQLDLMFSPRGSVLGSEAGTGKIHFVIDTLENIQSSWLRTTDYEEGDRVQLPARNFSSTTMRFNPSFTPYDRIYVCKTAGTSAGNPAVFLNTGTRNEGDTVSDGSVRWEVQLNATPSLLTLFTRTGSVNAYPMYFDFAGNVPPDVFKYAETGEAAK